MHVSCFILVIIFAVVSCHQPQIINTIKMAGNTKLKLRWLVACLGRKQKNFTIDQGNRPVRVDRDIYDDPGCSTAEMEYDSLGLQQTKEALSDGIVALLNNSGSSEESVEMLLPNDLDTAMRYEDDEQQLRKDYSSVNVRTCKSKVCGVKDSWKSISFIKPHSLNRAMF